MFWSLTAWEVLSKALPHNDKDALNFLFEGLGRISCIAPKSERSGSVQKKNSGGRCNEHIPNMHSLDTHKRRSVAICRGSTECRHRHHGTQWRETKRKHTVGGEFKYTKAIENWIKKRMCGGWVWGTAVLNKKYLRFELFAIGIWWVCASICRYGWFYFFCECCSTSIKFLGTSTECGNAKLKTIVKHGYEMPGIVRSVISSEERRAASEKSKIKKTESTESSSCSVVM